MADWHGESAAAWGERWDVPDVRIFRSVGSTNDVALALAEAGAPARTVVLADEQTRGRGRRGRSWRAANGRSLLLSMVLRPEEQGHPETPSSAPAPAFGAIPLRVGLAAARAVEEVAGVGVAIKWPNDLLLNGRKVGGILCEGGVEGGRSAFVVAGIGLNVLQADDEWPADLRGLATSIAAETGRTVAMPDLAGRVVAELSIACAAGVAPLDDAELESLGRRDALRGRVVTVDARPAGTALRIDADGALVVRQHGEERRIVSGTVRSADDGHTPESDDA